MAPTEKSVYRLHRVGLGNISLEDILRSIDHKEQKISLHPETVRAKIWFGLSGSESSFRYNKIFIMWRQYRINYFAFSFAILFLLSFLTLAVVWPSILSIGGQSTYDAVWIVIIAIIIDGAGLCVLIATGMESIFPPSASLQIREDHSGNQIATIQTQKVAYVWPSLKVSRESFDIEAIVILHYYRPLLKQVPFLSNYVSLYGAFLVSKSMECFHLIGETSPARCVSGVQHLLRMAAVDDLIPVFDLSDQVDITIMPR